MDLTAGLAAILFDKDGTLFDFHKTWNAWAGSVLHELAAGDDARLAELAAVLRFDLEANGFADDSPVIASTNREIAGLIAPIVGADVSGIERFLSYSAAHAPMAPVVPLAPLLDALRQQGLLLGVMTNDAEASARAHLSAVAVEDRFAMIIGADSGYGGKPSPSPLLAFADSHGLAPERVLMVGDSTHDLIAGRAAGMRTMGVLSGPAGADTLRPYADAILPDIGHLPVWVAQQRASK